MKRLFNYFMKDSVRSTEDESFVEKASEIQEDYPSVLTPVLEAIEAIDTEAEDMTVARKLNDSDDHSPGLSQMTTEIASNELQEQQQQQQQYQQPQQVLAASSLSLQQQQRQPETVNSKESSADVSNATSAAVAVIASPSEESLSPFGNGDETNAGSAAVSNEDLKTTATASTGSACGSISSSGGLVGGSSGSGNGSVISNGVVGESTSTNSNSWEPKVKDTNIAEKGDSLRITMKDTGDMPSGKLGKPEVIHPLQNSWGIWCFMQNRSQDWHENVRHISNFSSVEDFWSLFNHIQTVDNLPIGCDYYIFKANIQPMWEDKANVNGGRWLLKVPQSQVNFVQLWIETLLLLVGEAFDTESDSICGAVAQVRRGFNKISIWTKEAANRKACMRIGYRWKACIKTSAPIHYEAHLEVNNRKGGRRSNSVYSIN